MGNTIKSIIYGMNIPFDYKFLIQLLTEKISENNDIEKIYLFGSCATGEATEKSDIDFAVIVSDKTPADRSFRLGIINEIENMLLEQENVVNIPYDIIFFNGKDFERNKGIGISVARDIAQKGQIIYER